MNAQTIRQGRALAAHRAELNKQAEARRHARHAAIRERLVRRFVVDRNGWVFAAVSAGIALGIAAMKVAS